MINLLDVVFEFISTLCICFYCAYFQRWNVVHGYLPRVAVHAFYCFIDLTRIHLICQYWNNALEHKRRLLALISLWISFCSMIYLIYEAAADIEHMLKTSCIQSCLLILVPFPQILDSVLRVRYMYKLHVICVHGPSSDIEKGPFLSSNAQ